MTIRILVVDDSVVIRKLLTATLAEVPGMEVVATAALGKIALAKIPQVHPDIVILDVEMPEMDGIETLKLIRKDAPRLPVIMFSTKTERGAAATIEALTCGASDYVAKPSNVGNVLTAMARVRDEMVPKIQALTGQGAPGVRPPAGPAGSGTAATNPRAPAKMLSQAILRPPAGDSRSAASESGPTVRFGALAAPQGLTAAASNAAAEPRATTRFRPVAPPGGPAPAAPPPAALSAPPEPRLTTRLSAFQDGLAMLASPAMPSPAATAAVPVPQATTSELRATAMRSGALRRAVDIVAIGASTGGPNALATVLMDLPAEFPAPIVIVQHMLATFTRHFAERLASQCRIKIVEAVAGKLLEPGHAYIARGDYHLLVERRGGRPCLAMNQDEFENYCRPAVDVLFRSVAQLYGTGTLGVVLTGMGHDGLAGCSAIREAGGDVIVQDEASSVVWGMPGFVARAGLASQVIPIDQLGSELRRRVVLGAPYGAEASP